VIASAGLIASLSRQGFSQSPARPAFEVASIRPNTSGLSAPLDFGPKRFSAMGMSLNVLTQWAYDVRDFQVTGGPDWLNSARYDVQATTAEAVSQSQMRLMLQSLLTDRCHLQLHRDTREFSGYDLTIAKNGPKFQPVKEGSARGGIQIRSGVLSGRGAPMATLAGALTILVERPVLDKTALDGNYDFKLEYDPSTVFSREAALGNPPTAGPSPGASIFTALQEQLGLRLESRKGPLEILVIDRLEKPSEN
jgi:uncharacterized protein (TIGR03435 family)